MPPLLVVGKAKYKDLTLTLERLPYPTPCLEGLLTWKASRFLSDLSHTFWHVNGSSDSLE